MNKEFVKLSEKHNCHWLDLTEKLRGNDENLNKDFTFDGLHVNVEAYKIIAENIIPLLVK